MVPELALAIAEQATAATGTKPTCYPLAWVHSFDEMRTLGTHDPLLKSLMRRVPTSVRKRMADLLKIANESLILLDAEVPESGLSCQLVAEQIRPLKGNDTSASISSSVGRAQDASHLEQWPSAARLN